MALVGIAAVGDVDGGADLDGPAPLVEGEGGAGGVGGAGGGGVAEGEGLHPRRVVLVDVVAVGDVEASARLRRHQVGDGGPGHRLGAVQRPGGVDQRSGGLPPEDDADREVARGVVPGEEAVGRDAERVLPEDRPGGRQLVEDGPGAVEVEAPVRSHHHVLVGVAHVEGQGDGGDQGAGERVDVDLGPVVELVELVVALGEAPGRDPRDQGGHRVGGPAPVVDHRGRVGHAADHGRRGGGGPAGGRRRRAGAGDQGGAGGGQEDHQGGQDHGPSTDPSG